MSKSFKRLLFALICVLLVWLLLPLCFVILDIIHFVLK